MLTIEDMKANQPDDVFERAGYWQGNAIVLAHRLTGVLEALKAAETFIRDRSGGGETCFRESVLLPVITEAEA